MKTPHRSDAQSPEEERELRSVVALLRSLPDPEPPDDLSTRILAEVHRRESRPRVLRVAFRRMEPLVASAVAAGIGAVVFATAIQQGGGGAPAAETGTAIAQAETAPLQPFAARRVEGSAPAEPAPVRRRIDPVLVSLGGSDPYTAHLQGAPSSAQLAAALSDRLTLASNPLDRRLDQDLNSLLLDPRAFYRRLEQMGRPGPFVGRLIDRATRRGDAAQIALRLRVRAPDHPFTPFMVDHLLSASMVSDPRH